MEKPSFRQLEGEFIGWYVDRKSEAAYCYNGSSPCPIDVKYIVNDNGKYLIPISARERPADPILFAPSSRKHARLKASLKKVSIKEKPVFAYDGVYNNPVLKPYESERLNPNNFQGPYTAKVDSKKVRLPVMIEKIVANGHPIFLGIVNKKLATYSVYFDEEGKKNLHLINIEEISEAQSNPSYLKNRAKEALAKIMNKEEQNINERNSHNLANRRSVYKIFNSGADPALEAVA